MNKPKFDLIVIGTGPASSTVAKKAADGGKSIAIIESNGYGGTCALRGCNPKKVYSNAASLIDRVSHAGKLGSFENPRIDWSELLAFKNKFTDPVPENSESKFKDNGIETYHGFAKFVDDRTVEVGGQQLAGERFFMGVGAEPAPLEIEGAEDVITSREFFQLSEMPDHVVFIGGGYISMEFAHVVARYGSKAIVIDRNDQPLAGFDPDLVQILMKWSVQAGIEFQCRSKVASVSKSKSGFTVDLKRADGSGKSIPTKLVVHGAGRIPRLSGLNLSAANVEHSEKGIVVDEFMRSVSNPRIFAAGDCGDHGQPMLTPVANEQARAVSKNIFATTPENVPEYGAVPKVVFTSPCLAAVGLSEHEANEQGHDFEVLTRDTSTWGSVRKTGQECAGYKILIDKKTNLLLGAHLLGPAAEEVINIFTLAMRFGLTATDLKSTLFAYPTFGADIRRMV